MGAMDSPTDLPLFICKVDSVSEFEPAFFTSTLTAGELARAARFRTLELQRRALLARLVVRRILSWYQPSIAPSDWRFESEARGKPFIQNQVDKPLYFNLSHSTDTIALTLAPFPLIGVDVEHIRSERNHDLVDIAKHSFSEAEVEALTRLDPAQRSNHFYRLWTLKEAFIKATGEGLSMGLKTFGFTQLNIGSSAVTSMQVHGKARSEPQKPWLFWQSQWQQHMLALAIQPDINMRPPHISPSTVELAARGGAMHMSIEPLVLANRPQWITSSVSE